MNEQPKQDERKQETQEEREARQRLNQRMAEYYGIG